MNDKETRKVAVELTRKQYLALLKAVYLGNWMANAQRDGSPMDPLIDDYEEMLHFVFSQAHRYGLEKYANQESEGSDAWHPTRLFEEGTGVRDLQDAYDDAVFWEELAERLGERDFHARHSEEDIAAMQKDDYMHRHHEYIDRYDEELATHGLDRLQIADGGGTHDTKHGTEKES